MSTVMTNIEFANRLKDVATDYKTLYVMGCFGAPLCGSNVATYCNNYAYNKRADRTAMIKKVANQNPPVYGFDCVCLIKGILWGWNGTASALYGGAKYASNGVPDIDTDAMIFECSDLSSDFSNIEVGEAVWSSGHIGVYVGDGLAVECTPAWENKVQITACNCSKNGYERRDWTKHGKLPYVKYITEKSSALNVGDVVTFTGNTHYISAYGTTLGSPCESGKARITAISEGGANPYHLIAVNGGGSTVYGWVNASDIAGAKDTAPRVGDRVKLTDDALVYGKNYKFYPWVYSSTLYVREIDGNRVVVSVLKTGAVTGEVDKKYLVAVE